MISVNEVTIEYIINCIEDFRVSKYGFGAHFDTQVRILKNRIIDKHKECKSKNYQLAMEELKKNQEQYVYLCPDCNKHHYLEFIKAPIVCKMGFAQGHIDSPLRCKECSQRYFVDLIKQEYNHERT